MIATSPIPSEILDRCRLLKQQWAHAQRPIAPQTGFREERVRNPRSPHLRATVQLKQLGSAGVAQPHFLIECEDLRRHAALSTGRQRAPVCRISSNSPGENKKLRDLSVKGEATRRSLMTPA